MNKQTDDQEPLMLEATLLGSPTRKASSRTAVTTSPVGRIPATLQAVFLASNRGNEVHNPPPAQVAFKVFQKNSKVLFGCNAAAEDESGKKRKGRRKREKKTRHDNKKEEEASPQQQEEEDESGLDRSTENLVYLSPQSLLDGLLLSRGYSTTRYNTLQTAYYSKPTALQLASYDGHMIRLIRKQDIDGLDQILRAGVSANPCNNFGESLVHMVCRRGDTQLLKLLLEHGCSVQVADDYGRTPLHDACWAAKPCFELIELLLSVDRRLFHMSDCRGAVPLAYVRKNHWPEWTHFLETRRDKYWPRRRADADPEGPPHLTTLPPHSNPVPSPYNALFPSDATRVASGKMHPSHAMELQCQRLGGSVGLCCFDAETAATEEDSYYDDDLESYSGTEFGEDDLSHGCCSESSFDDDEFAEILKTLSGPKGSA